MNVRQLHRDLGDFPGPQPSAGAPEGEWDSWTDAAAFDSMIAGMVSRPAEPRDHAYLRELREALARPGLRKRLGTRLPTAEALVQALADRM